MHIIIIDYPLIISIIALFVKYHLLNVYMIIISEIIRPVLYSKEIYLQERRRLNHAKGIYTAF